MRLGTRGQNGNLVCSLCVRVEARALALIDIGALDYGKAVHRHADQADFCVVLGGSAHGAVFWATPLAAMVPERATNG